MTVSSYCSKKRPRGRPFRPGQSGNPGGKVRKEVAVAIMDMRQMARSYTAEALEKLVQLMRGQVKVGDNVHPVPVHTQGWAAAELIDRGWGRAPQGLEVTGANGGPIEVEERTAREYVLRRIAGIRERLLTEGLVIDATPVEASDSERPN
jgi:hypothetical protein